MAKLICFDSDGVDYRCRQVFKPTVAKFKVATNKYVYIVIGTDYGYIRTSAGDLRTWISYSSARKAALKYQSGV